jgi:hypothetical protein
VALYPPTATDADADALCWRLPARHGATGEAGTKGGTTAGGKGGGKGGGGKGGGGKGGGAGAQLGAVARVGDGSEPISRLLGARGLSGELG